jgi:hypothetical protein
MLEKSQWNTEISLRTIKIVKYLNMSMKKTEKHNFKIVKFKMKEKIPIPVLQT